MIYVSHRDYLINITGEYIDPDQVESLQPKEKTELSRISNSPSTDGTKTGQPFYDNSPPMVTNSLYVEIYATCEQEPNVKTDKTASDTGHAYEHLHLPISNSKPNDNANIQQDKTDKETTKCCRLDVKMIIILALVAVLVLGAIAATVVILKIKESKDSKGNFTFVMGHGTLRV